MCYVIEYGDTDLFAPFLTSIGFGDPRGKTEYNCDVRYRALWVLQTVVDAATLEELTKRDISTFKYKRIMTYYRLQFVLLLTELHFECFSGSTSARCTMSANWNCWDCVIALRRLKCVVNASSFRYCGQDYVTCHMLSPF